MSAQAVWTPPRDLALDRDFMRRFGVAEDIKTAMRRRYATAQPRSVRHFGDCSEAGCSPMCPVGRAQTRSFEFWSEYELVNRAYLPEDPVYTGTRGGVTLTTTDDLETLTSPSTGQARVLESFVGGESTASTVLRFALQLSTGGATPTNQTPEKMNSRSPAAASLFRTAWTTDPTLSGVPLIYHAFNTFGGTDRWVPQPGAEIYLVNGEQLSGRSAAGVPVVSSHLIFEEL